MITIGIDMIVEVRGAEIVGIGEVQEGIEGQVEVIGAAEGEGEEEEGEGEGDTDISVKQFTSTHSLIVQVTFETCTRIELFTECKYQGDCTTPWICASSYCRNKTSTYG
jgi:hypothetical protein